VRSFSSLALSAASVRLRSVISIEVPIRPMTSPASFRSGALVDSQVVGVPSGSRTVSSTC
jgi:hypothetical protein